MCHARTIWGLNQQIAGQEQERHKRADTSRMKHGGSAENNGETSDRCSLRW